MRLAWTLGLLGVCLGASSVSAHEADLIHLRLVQTGPGAYEQTARLSVSALAQLVPLERNADGSVSALALDSASAALKRGVWDGLPLSAGHSACQRGQEGARLSGEWVELAASFQCGADAGPLVQQLRILDLLPAGFHASVTFPDGTQQQLSSHARTWQFQPPNGSSGPSRGWGAWVLLGVEHIATGLDHLLFVLALLLVGGGARQVLGWVTAFTVAHSLTLGLTVLGVVSLSASQARAVEIFIALSIIYVAIENLLGRGRGHRVWVTFAFGLVHGFGFASMLTGLGLGESRGWALLGFNLGVELGQAALVVVAFPLLRWLESRSVIGHRALRVTSGSILCVGAYWLVVRAIG